MNPQSEEKPAAAPAPSAEKPMLTPGELKKQMEDLKTDINKATRDNIDQLQARLEEIEKQLPKDNKELQDTFNKTRESLDITRTLLTQDPKNAKVAETLNKVSQFFEKIGASIAKFIAMFLLKDKDDPSQMTKNPLMKFLGEKILGMSRSRTSQLLYLGKVPGLQNVPPQEIEDLRVTLNKIAMDGTKGETLDLKGLKDKKLITGDTVSIQQLQRIRGVPDAFTYDLVSIVDGITQGTQTPRTPDGMKKDATAMLQKEITATLQWKDAQDKAATQAAAKPAAEKKPEAAPPTA